MPFLSGWFAEFLPFDVLYVRFFICLFNLCLCSNMSCLCTVVGFENVFTVTSHMGALKSTKKLHENILEEQHLKDLEKRPKRNKEENLGHTLIHIDNMCGALIRTPAPLIYWAAQSLFHCTVTHLHLFIWQLCFFFQLQRNLQVKQNQIQAQSWAAESKKKSHIIHYRPGWTQRNNKLTPEFWQPSWKIVNKHAIRIIKCFLKMWIKS